MKRWKKSRQSKDSKRKLQSFADFMGIGSNQAERLREDMHQIVKEQKTDWTEYYNFNKKVYEDIFGTPIEDDEDIDNT